LTRNLAGALSGVRHSVSDRLPVEKGQQEVGVGWSMLSRWLPGYGGSRVLLDGAFTSGFDETLPMLLGLGWLVALGATVALSYRRAVRPCARTSSGSR